ncbi:MAG: hypothetical protein JST81_08610 [Bacteroidetes bacterium]|jgi:hypothetical protein|nr:hypothetical protein [Bacteroidota bacterium]
MKKNIINSLAIVSLCLAMYSCKKTDADSGVSVNATTPTVVTNDPSSIAGNAATVGGNIKTDNGTIVTEAGICYSDSPGVDTSDIKIAKYVVGGNYSVNLTGLSLLSTYYYRAYAINAKGIAYGDEKTLFVPVNGYSTSAEVAAANLKAHWAFENNYNDAVSGTAGTANHASAISFVSGGIKGSAVEIASPGYINSNITSTVANLQSLSISTWIKQPAALMAGPTTYFPFSLNKAGYSWEQTKFFMLFDTHDNATNSKGKVCLMDQWFDPGQVWPRMLDELWHQMIITYDGTSGELRVYVDGSLLSQSSSTSFNPQANFGDADSFTLGGPDDNANAANGWMNSLSGDLDEVKIFDRVLTADEALALFALESHGL